MTRTVEAIQVPASAVSPDLVDEDPRDILARVIAETHARSRETEMALAEARHALARLRAGTAFSGGSGAGAGGGEVARVTLEVAPSLVSSLLTATSGPLRNLVMTTTSGAGAEQETDTLTREVLASGREQRALYDASVLHDAGSVARAAAYREAGEQQRVYDGVPTEFCVFGDEAVVCPDTWGDPAADYVLIRDPMLITAFQTWFDQAWEQATPFPIGRATSAEEDAQLLDLLSRGLKDEAIARYLGWSLRTVRRRVARLMDSLGARTRFQLGAHAVRSGRLRDDAAHSPVAVAGVDGLGRPVISR